MNVDHKEVRIINSLAAMNIKFGENEKALKLLALSDCIERELPRTIRLFAKAYISANEPQKAIHKLSILFNRYANEITEDDKILLSRAQAMIASK